MRSQFLIFAFLLICLSSAFPQGMTDKGSISLSGTASYFTTSSEDDASDFTFSIVPEISYFIADNIEIGSRFQFRYNESEDSYYGETHTTVGKNFGIGPFIAGYFGSAPAKPFIFASFDYSAASFSFSNGPREDNHSTTLTFGAGYLIPLNTKVAVTPLLQYEIFDYSEGDALDSKSFILGAQFKIFL